MDAMDAMDGMTLEHLMMDILTSSAHHNSLTQQEGDFGAFKYKVKVLLDNLLVKFDQDVHYQRDLEEQIDNLEVENMGKDKCRRCRSCNMIHFLFPHDSLQLTINLTILLTLLH